METITLHSRVGADGLLKLQVPVNLTNTELEVVLIVQPVGSASQVPGWPPEFFKEVAGGWQGELLLREEQRPYEVREVASQVKRLPLQERLLLLETLTRSVREELKSAAERPRSAAGKDLRHLAGTISPEDAGQMREAIEQGCERVGEHEW
jgi:hypothetical protein